jgi:hypothetical protein
MPFSEITRERFDELNQPDRCEGLWSREHERAWFACDSNNILGVLLENPHSGRWGYMLCVRSEQGGYRRVGLGADIPGETLARRALASAMEGYRACGPLPD